MHQDVKGAALCLSDPTSRNLTKRERYTAVTNKHSVCPESFLPADNDENLSASRYGAIKNGTVHGKDSLSRPNTKLSFS